MSLNAAIRAIRQAATGNEHQLSLGGLNLHKLPAELFQLHHLRVLYVNRNKLTALPPDIGTLSLLEELYLQDNQLCVLPDEIGNLTRLRLLVVMRNQLTAIPATLGRLSGLTKLRLDQNGLLSLPPEIGHLSNVQTLNLANNHLTTLPHEIGGLRRMTSLEADGNDFVTLPSSIGALSGLQTLRLSGSRLATLPPEIGDLHDLRFLDLSDNQLAHLPSTIGRLRSLVTLCLQNNRLTALPTEVGRLGKLESMNLNDNQLTELPPDIGDLLNLTSLTVLNNRLTSLPQDVGRLRSLKQLALHHEQPLDLPLSARVRRWDAFISYASEDRESVAIPLARALQAAGLKIWIDDQALTIGDSLREKIDAGLSNSRFGIVVLSPSFFAKGWTQREFNALIAIEDGGDKVVLPVWHSISRQTLLRNSPILADRVAADTTDGIHAVATKLVDVILWANDSPSVLFPSVARLLVMNLRFPDAALRVREFLVHHPDILKRAADHTVHGMTVVRTTVGHETPSLICDCETETTHMTRFVMTFVLASPMGLATDVTDLMRGYFCDEPQDWHEAFIIVGRRYALNKETKARLKAFNDEHRYIPDGRLQGRAVSARTYDWLVDLCLSQDHARLRSARVVL